jgi:two-component system LytT family response regulator
VLKILIADDEAPARERLKGFLSQNESVELVGEAEDGIRAVELIEENRPDLVLLDIQMPRLDGFGVIKMLENPPLVIFITAYDEYAIQAFEVNAIDYLLKPFTQVRLERAIEKAAQELSRKTDYNTRLEGLFKTLSDQKRHLERIAVRSQGKILVVDVDKIDTFAAESGQVSVVIGEKRYLSNYTLNELQERLNPETFFRAHRSAIVNLTKVREIIPWFAGSYKIKLTSGAEVDLSRIQATELRKIIRW